MNIVTEMKEIISCNRCVMDTTAPSIMFNEMGVCNFCTSYFEQMEVRFSGNKKEELDELVLKMKKAGKGKKYDCVIGVSGGVDSTYVAYLVKELGLRPLAIHLDNGWNSELAVENIHRTLSKLKIELHTHVIDWVEIREIQKSFLKASIPGMEIPTDHAIYSILREIANKEKIEYIVNGSNFKTEFIMERAWSEMMGQLDWLLIKNIHRQFGNGFFKSYPRTSRWAFYKARLTKKPKVVYFLDYIDFSKEEAMKFIQDELGWVYYGGKHYESIYTRFTQAYIQPKKFGIDKRKAHFSNLICMGEMSKSQASEELMKSAYPSAEMELEDKELVLKKLKITEAEFVDIMKAPVHTFKDYNGYHNSIIHSRVFDLVRTLYKLTKRVRGKE